MAPRTELGRLPNKGDRRAPAHFARDEHAISGPDFCILLVASMACFWIGLGQTHLTSGSNESIATDTCLPLLRCVQHRSAAASDHQASKRCPLLQR
jgi:hypothetical protein